MVVSQKSLRFKSQAFFKENYRYFKENYRYFKENLIKGEYENLIKKNKKTTT